MERITEEIAEKIMSEAHKGGESLKKHENDQQKMLDMFASFGKLDFRFGAIMLVSGIMAVKAFEKGGVTCKAYVDGLAILSDMLDLGAFPTKEERKILDDAYKKVVTGGNNANDSVQK